MTGRYVNPAQTIILKCDGKSRHTARPRIEEAFSDRSFDGFFRAALLWLLAVLILVAARWIDPPTTAVHIERRLQAWIHHTPYRKRYEFVPLSQISPELQHAVIAAEDARFYQHHGFDWHAIEIAAEDDMEGGRFAAARRLRSNW